MPNHTLNLEALDVVIVLEVSGDTLAEAVRQAWVDAIIAPPADDARPRRTLSVAVGEESGAHVSGRDVRGVLHNLSSAVTRAALDARAGDLILLHAAALAHPDTGATAALVAASGTGKTTASIALGRELVYLSDETAGIDANGRVARYRKPLSVVVDDHLKAQVAPSAHGLRLEAVDGRLATVLHLERDPAHVVAPHIEAVEMIDAFTLLAPQTSAFARTERPLHRLAELLESVGGLMRVRYAEADTLLPVLHELLTKGAL